MKTKPIKHWRKNMKLTVVIIILFVISIIFMAGKKIKISVNPANIISVLMKQTSGKYDYGTLEDYDLNIYGLIKKYVQVINTRAILDEKVKIYGNAQNWYLEGLCARGERKTERKTEKTSEKNTENDTKEDEEKENKSEENTTEKVDNTDNNKGEGADANNIISEKIYVNMPSSCGIKYSYNQLSDSNFTFNKFYTVPSGTKLLSSDVDIDSVLSYDMTLKQDNAKPQILIYHTHSLEGYCDSTNGDLSTGVVGVGDYLEKILKEQFRYNVLHIKESFDVDENGNPDRTNAYVRARKYIEKILKENPSIEVILDVHRDGVDDSLHFVTDINGKPTSKIMFFNGLCRNSKGVDINYGTTKYRSENLAMSLQMKLLAEEFYPDFTRKNYVNAYHYNMNFRGKSMLIEVGAQTNTFAEAKNAMEPLSVLLNKLLQ